MKRRHYIAIAVLVSAAATFVLATRSTGFKREFDHGALPDPGSLSAANQEFQQNFEKFQSLTEQALAWRMSATNEIGRLRAKADAGVPLTAEDLLYIHDGAGTYAGIRLEILALAREPGSKRRRRGSTQPMRWEIS